MGCREVKRRLNEAGEIDGELLKHLDRCPECSREVAAWRLIESTLENARSDHEEPATPFAEIRAKITADTRREKEKENSIMSEVQKQIVSHRRFSIALVVAVAVFVFAVLVPFSYDRTVGYNIAYTGLDSEYEFSPEILEGILTSLGYELADVELTHNGSFVDYRISDLPSRTAAREVSAAFASLTGYTGMPVITPIIKTVSGSLYAQVKDKLVKIEIEGKGKTDAEVRAEIEKKLAADGHSNPQVTVTTKPDGMREIRIGLEESSETGMKEKRLEITTPKDDSVKIKCPLVEVSVDSKDKTDAQIKEEIKQKLAAEGVQEADISVTTDSSGKRNIEIRVEKEE